MSARESRPVADSRTATRTTSKEGDNQKSFSTSILPDDPAFSPEYEGRLQGFCEGWQARQNEIDRLNTIADYWYLRANHSSAQIKEFEARRMDDAFKRIEAEFFGGAQ